jgi:hypothetical protein
MVNLEQAGDLGGALAPEWHRLDDVPFLFGCSLGFRPEACPLDLASRSPAPVRSRIISRSNSANEPSALVAAIAALLNMAAKGGGAASLDCAHSAMLGTGQRRSVLNAESRAEAAEHIRHLQPLASHGTLHAAAPIEAMAA